MKKEPRHNKYGDTVSEWISTLPEDIDDIGIGLGQVVRTGRYNFELKGEDLIEFVRRSIRALVDRGGRPRHWGSPSQPDRNIELHYGTNTPEEIVEGVIADWLASGAGDLEWGDFWFDLPELRED